jgi:hypothetical protein
MSDHLVQFVASVSLALVTALITIGSVWLQGWLSRRTHEQRRRLMLADAQLEIQVIEGFVRIYLDVAKDADTVVSRARQDLERIYERMEEQPGVKLGDRAPTSFRHAARHLLVLDRPIHGVAALTRTLLYMSFLWVLFCAWVAVAVMLDGTLAPSSRVTAPIFVAIIAIAPPLGLRALTVGLANRRHGAPHNLSP